MISNWVQIRGCVEIGMRNCTCYSLEYERYSFYDRNCKRNQLKLETQNLWVCLMLINSFMLTLSQELFCNNKFLLKLDFSLERKKNFADLKKKYLFKDLKWKISGKDWIESWWRERWNFLRRKSRDKLAALDIIFSTAIHSYLFSMNYRIVCVRERWKHWGLVDHGYRCHAHAASLIHG
jgi:hypothetical protein